MRLALLLVALSGYCLGLQNNLEYQYHYEGWVATGLNDVSSQVAVSLIHMDVTIQVVMPTRLRIKFSNIHVADSNEKFMCDGTMPDHLPNFDHLEHTPLEKHVKELEAPFMMDLDEKKDDPFRVSQKDPEWVNNIRRSVMHLFHIPVMAANHEGTKDVFSMGPSFAQDEHSPIGQCLNIYHLMPLSESMEQYYPRELDSDYQRSDSGTPDLEDQLWLLERMVDFRRCNDLVASHSLGLPMDGNRGHDKCGLHEEYMSRSQSSFFVVRGGSKGVRLETASMAGNYIVDPIGTNEEHLHTWTNQTMTLREVRPIENKFVIKKPVGKSWRHNMTAFNWDRENENFILGDISDFEDIDQSVAETRDTNRRMIQQLQDILHGGRPIEGAEGLDAMSKNMAMLSQADLQEDYDMLDGEARQMYMKLLTATGYKRPYHFLLEKFKNGDEVDTSNILDFILNMGNNVKSQELIQPIMEWVMHDLEDYPGLRSLAIINFARLATRICLNPCGQEFLGDSSCGITSCRQNVIDNFLPFITDGLNDENNDDWMRMVYMQAFDNFYAEEIIPVLRPYVIGLASRHEPLRVTAMYALRRDSMPKAASYEVFNLLDSVYSNYEEYYRVREAALGMMLQWEPPAAWWHQLAMSSWREPHIHMVAFINKIINTFKYSTPAVQRVARLVKPAAPRSMYDSFITYDLKSNESEMLRYWYELMVSGNNQGLFPRMAFFYLRLGFINQKFNALKVGVHADHTDLWNMFYKMFGFGVDNPHPEQPNVQDMYQRINRLLKNQQDEEHGKHLFFIYKVFRSFQALVNFPVGDTNIEDWKNFLTPSSMLEMMGSVMNFNRQIFVNTGRITKGIATELGIPLMVQFSTPNLFSVHSKAYTDNQDGITNMDLDFNFRVDRLKQVTSRTLVPWSGKAVVSGLNSRMTVTLPFKHNIQYDSNNNYMHITVYPSDQENTKEMFGLSNEPFTVRAPFILTPRLSSLEDYSIVRTHPEYKEDRLLWSRTGLNFGAVFVGDTEPFFTQEKLQDFYGGLYMNQGLDAFSPTAKYFLFRFGADFMESEANSFTISLHYDNEITEYDMDGIPVQAQTSVSADVTFNMDDAENNRRFGSKLNWLSGFADQRYASKIHLELIDLYTSTCFNIQSQIPYVPQGTTTEEFFNINNNMIFMLLVSQGEQCSDSSPGLQIQGEFTISEEHKIHHTSEENLECDLRTIRRNTHDEFFIPNYDHAVMQARWDQSLPLDTPAMSYMARVFIPGSLFPDLKYSYHETDVEPGLATFTANRYKDSAWEIHFKKSSMEAEANIHVQPWVENLFFSPQTIHMAFFDQFVVNHERLPTCHVAQDHVETFDKVIYPAEIDRCWVVAVKDCGNEAGVHTGMVMVRKYNGKLEVRILWPAGGIKVDMGQDSVMINGQPVDANTYDSLYKVHNFGGGMSVQLNQFVVVKVTDKIVINVHPSERGSVCGICGNYDDEKRGDLRAPSGCIYDDIPPFVTSWKLPGDRCNNRNLKKEKRGLKDLERDCKKFSWSPSGEVMEKLQRSCFEYHYETRKQGPYMCTAMMPTASCKANCTMFESSSEPVLYECKLRDDYNQNKQQSSDYQGDDPDYAYDYDYDDEYYDQQGQEQEQAAEIVEEEYVEEESEEDDEEEIQPQKEKKNKKDKKDKKDKKPKKPEPVVRYGGNNLAEYPRKGCHYYTYFTTNTITRCN